ncbi:hypothetical protein Z517_01922 [Fonsecaea pedrosoi CBS 271.37]|uniref:Unplaced genomic scaffold supercont1.1, whole genome shotgun sequence n=1 Tax=Fonsecaea pedrosoi CBS 271.37 TaxID=1442368 RepID=A0A0D2HQ09_9EURO|nr:uncharacterized protein Z517_01922 [Fonsecaea pedrosoi CBS 271.37]KIW86524.1 hypothetical protein Z517_01922 [Fonsecaea pedrosoi CBS 271.37]
MKFRRSLRLPRADNSGLSNTSFTRLRIVLFMVNFIKWASACIVMAIVSYFIHDYSRDLHTTYQEIIACTCIGFFLPTIPLAFHKRFTVQLIPLDYIYSHLWVTAFIFAAEDYNRHPCSSVSPPGVRKCSLKYALESWCIIAVSFCVFSTIVQVLIYRSERDVRHSMLLEKTRQSVETTDGVQDTTGPEGVEPVGQA